MRQAISKLAMPAAELALVATQGSLAKVPKSMLPAVCSVTATWPLASGVGVRRLVTSLPTEELKAPKSCKLVYDAECPVCDFSADKVAKLENVELINARDISNPLVKQLEAEGHNLDEGMVLVDESGVRHAGSQGLEKIIAGSGESLARVWAARAMKPLYPSLRGVRNMIVGENTIASQRARESAEQESEHVLKPASP